MYKTDGGQNVTAAGTDSSLQASIWTEQRATMADGATKTRIKPLIPEEEKEGSGPGTTGLDLLITPRRRGDFQGKGRGVWLLGLTSRQRQDTLVAGSL